MSLCSISLLLLILILLEAVQGCRPSAKLVHCNEGGYNDRRTYYYYEEEVVITSCPQTTIREIKYELIDRNDNVRTFPKYLNKQVLILSHVEAPGKYILSVRIKDSNEATTTAQCTLTYSKEPPIINFASGRTKRVIANKRFTVSLLKSLHLNRSLPPPKWSAKCNRKPENNCRSLACYKTMAGLLFKAKYHSCFISVIFTISIRYIKYDIKDSIILYPQLTKLALRIYFSCTINCNLQGNRRTDPTEKTVLRLRCIRNCQKFPGVRPKWTVTELSTSKVISKGLTVSNNNKTLTIYDEVLKYNTRYIVNAYLRNNLYGAIIIQTIGDFKEISCSVSPNDGYSLETVFDVSCTPLSDYYKIHAPYIEVWQGNVDYLIFFKASQHLNFKTVMDDSNEGRAYPLVSIGDELNNVHQILLDDFPLPDTCFDHFRSLSKVILCITENKSMGHKCFSSPNLYIRFHQASTLKLRSTSDEDFGKILKSAKPLFSKGNHELWDVKAVGIIQKSAMNNLDSDSMKKYQLDILDVYDGLDITTMYDFRAIVSALDFIFIIKEKDYYKAAIKKLCHKIMNINPKHLLYVQYYSFPGVGMVKYYKVLDKCAKQMLESEELDRMSKMEKTTTVINVVDEPVITEEYDDYESPETELERDIKLDSIDLLLKSTELFVLVSPAEEPIDLDPNVCDRIASKEQARNLDKVQIDITAASIYTRGGFTDKFGSNITAAIILSCDKNMLDPESISSNIISVDFLEVHVDGLRRFNAPVRIEFDVELPTNDYESYNFTIPTNENEWHNPGIDYQYNVHRINLLHGTNCFVRFYNLSRHDKYMVVFTINIRPRYQDFDGTKYIIETKKEAINCPFDTDEVMDRFIYLGIMPHRDMLKPNEDNFTLNYDVQFLQQACFAYNHAAKMWANSSCEAEFLFHKQVPTVSCTCNHTTMFAAYVGVAESKLDEPYVISYETYLAWNYVVFAHIVLVLMCYAIALTFLQYRSRTSLGRDNVIYLSDNRKNDRYAYFIIVKTGSLPFSGTTSNVTIKLYGEYGEGESHVLNYPDPYKRFLKLDETNWFVLTNKVYLGHINMIEIWIDSIGYRPSWYCEHILIIDLQDNSEMFFKVDTWLSVEDKKYFCTTVDNFENRVIKKNFLLTLQKNFRFYKGGENTWNIFTRSEDDYLSYHQRITIILSMIYTTYILNILFVSIPDLKMSDAYGSGRYQFRERMIYIALYTSLLSCIINLPFVYLFRNSLKRKKTLSLLIEDALFGLKVTFITWAILISWVVLCLLYLLICCFWVTLYSSLEWITCTAISLIVSIFIVENVFIVIVKIFTIYFIKLKKQVYNLPQIIIEVERQRKILYKKFGELLLRPYFRRHYNKLSYVTYLKRKKREMERVLVSDLFRNMCVYLVFLAALYILVFIADRRHVHNSNRVMHKMVSGAYLKSKDRLSKVHHTDDIYNYINNTLRPVIHSTTWYEGFNLLDPGLIADFNSKILGVARLRQQRENQTCIVPISLSGLQTLCFNQEVNDSSWSNFVETEYKFSYIGSLKMYVDGGHIAYLGRTNRNTKYILKLLKRNKWLDLNTEVLFIEFWTYNANQNLFNAVRINIERDRSGDIITSKNIVTFSIYHSQINEIMRNISLLLISIAMMLLIFDIFWIIRKRKFRFLNNLWNIFDVAIIGITVAILVLYSRRQNCIRDLVERLEESKHNDFVDYLETVYITEWNNYLLAFLTCLATIKIWKYLRFGKHFQLLERSIVITARFLLTAFASQLHLFLSFCIFYYLIIGDFIWPFWCMPRSVLSIVLFSMDFHRGFDRGTLTDYGALVCTFFVAIMIISTVFKSLYCTIMMAGFLESRTYFSNRPKFYNLGTFINDEVKFRKELVKAEKERLRLKSGADEERYKCVTPKGPAQRYADCLFMTDDRLDLMKFVAISVIMGLQRVKQEQNLLDLDKLALNVMVRMKFLKSAPKTDKLLQNIFFRGKDPKTDRFRFVSNLRLLQMEYAVEELLHPSVKDADQLFKADILHMTGDADILEKHRKRLEIIFKPLFNIRLEDDQ